MNPPQFLTTTGKVNKQQSWRALVSRAKPTSLSSPAKLLSEVYNQIIAKLPNAVYESNSVNACIKFASFDQYRKIITTQILIYYIALQCRKFMRKLHLQSMEDVTSWHKPRRQMWIQRSWGAKSRWRRTDPARPELEFRNCPELDTL